MITNTSKQINDVSSTVDTTSSAADTSDGQISSHTQPSCDQVDEAKAESATVVEPTPTLEQSAVKLPMGIVNESFALYSPLQSHKAFPLRRTDPFVGRDKQAAKQMVNIIHNEFPPFTADAPTAVATVSSSISTNKIMSRSDPPSASTSELETENRKVVESTDISANTSTINTHLSVTSSAVVTSAMVTPPLLNSQISKEILKYRNKEPGSEVATNSNAPSVPVSKEARRSLRGRKSAKSRMPRPEIPQNQNVVVSVTSSGISSESTSRIPVVGQTTDDCEPPPLPAKGSKPATNYRCACFKLNFLLVLV